MFSKDTLKKGMKLRALNAEENSLASDKELEIEFPADDFCVVTVVATGKQKSPTYDILESLYELVPTMEPTEENFVARIHEDMELMIAHMAAYTATSAVGVDANILAIGSKLHQIKEEAESYLTSDEDENDEEDHSLLG